MPREPEKYQGAFGTIKFCGPVDHSCEEHPYRLYNDEFPCCASLGRLRWLSSASDRMPISTLPHETKSASIWPHFVP